MRSLRCVLAMTKFKPGSFGFILSPLFPFLKFLYLESHEDIVAIGGKLNVGTLLAAYEKGIFPWPQQGAPLLWFFPEQRGVLDFSDLHIPESLIKFIKKNSFRFRFSVNEAFPRF